MPVGVDEGAGVVAVAVGDEYGSAVFAEVVGLDEGGLDGDAALHVVVAHLVVVDEHDAAARGIAHARIEAGDDLVAVTVDEARQSVVQIDAAVVAVEFVDMKVDVVGDDGAVGAFETEEGAVAGGLDAIGEDEFTAAFFVVDIFDLLRTDVVRQESGEA